LRECQEADLGVLGALYYRSYPPGVAGTDVTEATADIAAAVAGEYGELWVAASPLVMVDAQLAGAIQVVRRAPWPDTPDCPFVIELFVAPEHRRQGLARLLLHEAMTVVAAAAAAEIALRVAEDNVAARGLYASLGFSEWAGSGR
jgi:ribosomal protein S18 acetylase RimI-like enzyme